ncbi:MAG: hypothetical protein V3S10_01220 [Dehalococcoidales bacterium]
MIIVYVIEAHPMGDPSPYSGEEWPESFSKDADGNPVRQPDTYAERVALARQTAADEKITVPLLVDGMDNAVWCSYGPAPNIAYLIDRDGTIVTRQDWYVPSAMADAVAGLLDGS